MLQSALVDVSITAASGNFPQSPAGSELLIVSLAPPLLLQLSENRYIMPMGWQGGKQQEVRGLCGESLLSY